MPGVLLWGWDGTNDVWIPLQVDTNGCLKVDMANINLGGLGDVSVASPGNGYFLYYDNVTKLWKAKAHADLTTGIHGAGSNYLALFGQEGIVVTKFTPKSQTTVLFRNHQVENSSFEALINGTPTATSVVYDNDVRELSLPDIATYPQWGKVILHNITRGNSRKITGVNTATNTITTESSSDNWANNDIITIGSQTCDEKQGYSYSRLFDIDISDEVPATAVAALIYSTMQNLSGIGSAAQDFAYWHPFETYSIAKLSGHACTAAHQAQIIYHTVPIIEQKICLGFGLYADVTASGMKVIVRLKGYWE